MAGQVTTDFLERDIMELPGRWRRCIEMQEEYLEKYVLVLK
jgi:hypothetical protein